jgi:hypothetical protein
MREFTRAENFSGRKPRNNARTIRELKTNDASFSSKKRPAKGKQARLQYVPGEARCLHIGSIRKDIAVTKTIALSCISLKLTELSKPIFKTIAVGNRTKEEIQTSTDESLSKRFSFA